MNKFYFHSDRPYLVLIPTIAIGKFWIEIDWLHMIVGYGHEGESNEP
jgi:hypothetical protein